MIPWHLHHHGDELQQINMNWKGFLHNISQWLWAFTNDKIDVQSHLQGSIIMKTIILVVIIRVIPMSSWQAMASSSEKICVTPIGFKQVHEEIITYSSRKCHNYTMQYRTSSILLTISILSMLPTTWNNTKHTEDIHETVEKSVWR